MTWLAIPILGIFGLYYLAVVKRIGILAADSLIAYLQLLMALGTLPLLDSQRHADAIHGYILTSTIILYMATGFVVHARKKPPVGGGKVGTFVPGFHTYALLFISILVVGAYYVAVGHVTLFAGLLNALAGGSNDVTTLRLEGYSGTRYLYPGYVNQFKNALLPALVIVIATYWVRRGRIPLFFASGLAVITLIALLGTGQRGAFVMAAVLAVVYVYMLDNRAFPRRSAGLLILIVPVILLATLALGRSSDAVGQEATFLGKAAVTASEFGGRILSDNQISSVAGFRYIYEQKEIQNGNEWLQSLLGVLPGQSGSDLANQIFATLYGSDRGTSPESIWASAYHNFGYVGTMLLPIILALIAAAITRRIENTPTRSTLTTVGMAGTITVLGFWVASTPIFLLNNGIMVYLAMWAIGARLDRRAGGIPVAGIPARSRRGHIKRANNIYPPISDRISNR